MGSPATFVRVVRALVLSNMPATADHPERGAFVRDQVRALERLPGADVRLVELASGAAMPVRAASELRRRFRGESFDVVHAHFGPTAWPALAVRARVRALTVHGTDVHHPVTRELTRAVIPLVHLLCAASAQLARELPWPSSRRVVEVLPCGVDLERFRPIERASARALLGLEADRGYLLLPADPARAEKRADRARALARAAGAELLTLGGIAPEEVPLWMNAASAVVIPSEREGFGLAALEALACEVPVLATPVGIHAEALADLPGTLCAAFDVERWREALAPHLAATDPRVPGRTRAEPWSAERMAERLLGAWEATLAGDPGARAARRATAGR
jgi:teichuronic acid biosynthesis glycosyltransferase TuaC